MAKIVIAEDDVTSRAVLVKGVELMGHTAIQCSDGLRAYYIVQDNPDIDMLITDMMMPNIDGRELIERVRSNEKFSALPILIISGAVGPKAIRDLLKLGATAFMGKPVGLEELSEYVGKYLESS